MTRYNAKNEWWKVSATNKLMSGTEAELSTIPKREVAMHAGNVEVPLVGINDYWLDAFGRLRTSDPNTLFESSFQYDLQPNLFDVKTSNGTVTHNATTRSADLAVSTNDAATAIVQSFQYHPYEKGRSQLVKVTFVLGWPVENVSRRVGYFDDANGFYLEQTSEGLFIKRRSSATGSVVELAVAQNEWNLDSLDGTGPSGHQIDPSKGQILVIDGQWLGVGRVRVGFNIDGLTFWAHQWLHANNEPTAPYTQTFALPVRWEITNTDASAGATFQAICCEVESEGGALQPTSLAFSALNTANVSTSTTEANVIAIRPTTDFPSGGEVNRQVISPQRISCSSVGATIALRIYYNPIFTGGDWTRANTHSGVEYSVNATTSSRGILIASSFVAAGQGSSAAAMATTIASQYPLTLDIDGANPRALLITATTLTGSGTVRAAIDWNEVR